MRHLFLKLFRRRALSRDIEAELAFHREMAAEHGNPIPLGNLTAIREQAFDLWRFNFFENLWRDLVYSARGLRRSPTLVLTALLSLGLGIGVNTAMFSLAVEFLFSEPSVTNPGSLVYVRVGGGSHASWKAVEFIRASGLFEDVAGENEEAFANFNDGTETHRIFAVYTTKNYFAALGAPMLYGRGIRPTDPDEVTVLRYDFWRKYFNSDPSIVGRTINLNGRICMVVGILPENHRTLLGFGFSPDLYVPRYLDDTVLAIYARLRPDMSISAARAGMLTVAKRMDAEMPSQWKYANVSVAPIAGFARLSGERELMAVGLFFALLLAVTGLVLLIACINVASLLLARGSARRREIAVRLALGSSRGRLLQQLLADSLLLSLLGAILGFVLAQVTSKLLASIPLPLPVPIRLMAQPDWRVAAYAAVMTVFTALACGVLPAWQSMKESLAPDLNRDGKLRLRRMLVGAQIATSVIVLATGFLFLRNLLDSSALSPGFDVLHTVRADVNLPPLAYADAGKKMLFVNRVIEQVSALPGVETVAAARIIPFTDNTSYGGRLRFSDNGETVHSYFRWNAVTPSFFRAMDIAFEQGSTFRGEANAVIVNRTFVTKYLGNRQPIGTD